ncbi:MAG: hypothetical protein N3B01_02345, partial [Verrucomicrobiae bacterium]|nr:hypothetical protein [Verrucomicrobiae bacterium]
MTALYYYWTLLNAAASLLVAALGFWKNRHQSIGTLFGVAMTFVAAWLVGFAQYFRPMNEQSALRWAFFTLTAAIANHPFILHCFCALVGEARRWRWIIATAYASTLFFLALLYSGHVVTGLRASPFMDHYVRYNRGWYPYLCAHLIVWEIIGTAILAHAAWKAPTYRRAHLLYFISAWMTCFLTTNLLIVPLEYDIN